MRIVFALMLIFALASGAQAAPLHRKTPVVPKRSALASPATTTSTTTPYQPLPQNATTTTANIYDNTGASAATTTLMLSVAGILAVLGLLCIQQTFLVRLLTRRI